MQKMYKVGYTQGTFDMFHIGHLNLLRQAKEKCEILIVGINSDSLVRKYKNKTPVISEGCRLEIIKAIKYVNDAFITDTLDKRENHIKKPFDVIFIGSDWKGNARWQQTESDLKKIKVDVVYLKHTDGISSTILRDEANNKISD